MSALARLVPLAVGAATPRAALPDLDWDDFADALLEGVGAGRRVVAYFGALDADVRARAPRARLYLVLADDERGVLAAATTTLADGLLPSLTPRCPELHLFEREIAEQLALRLDGHPWPAPVRFERAGRPGVVDFHAVQGSEVHEVGVGPVHAGVIEPGHFRFQCHGEEVFQLEIALGYQHRGVERALVGGPNRRSVHYAETAAGDTTIGHATAYAEVVEALAGAAVPSRGLAVRALALELERIANHVGDLGALAGDVGFLPTASYCGRIRGDFLNATAGICGSRLGRSLVRAGGVAFDLDPPLAERLDERLGRAFADARGAVELLWETPSVMERFEGTGRVSSEAARALALKGPAARAAGVDRDARRDHSTGHFRVRPIPVALAETGDVHARAVVRWLEVERSVAFARELLGALPPGPVRVEATPLAPDSLAVALVEGWRGEIAHVALTGADGRFERYKLVDPSFQNWQGLALALGGGPISDFPLVNKSFNLSYCGHDL